MIIPSLLAQQVRQPGEDSEDDDGLTAAERENIKKTLEKLSGAMNSGGPSTLDGTRVGGGGGGDAAPSIEQMLGAQETKVTRAKEPPVVKSAGVPISVPANRALEKEKEGEVVLAEEAPVAAAPPKKMSRFKARQMGLE
ncbi:hypothetical protein P7C70_g3579, partial [Phenoliferia sp. Uapishka_3]